MKKILFNTPLQKKKYFDNVKQLLNSKESLHGPGKNIFQINSLNLAYNNISSSL